MCTTFTNEKISRNWKLKNLESTQVVLSSTSKIQKFLNNGKFKKINQNSTTNC